MDIQDPLRMRLISHLQCFVAQREISVKPQNAAAWPTAPASSAVSAHHTPYALPHHQSAYGPGIGGPTPLPPTSAASTHTPILPASATSPMYHQGSGYPSSSSSAHLNHSISYTYIPNLPPTVATSGTVLCETQTSSSSTAPLPSEGSSLLAHQQQQQHYSQHEDQNGSTYTDLSSNIHRNAAVSIGYGNPQYPPSGAQGYSSSGAGDGGPTSPGSYNNNNKPYRPWGTGPEMAY